MDYNQAIAYIHSIPKFIRPLGNQSLAKLLDHLGNPQQECRFIHIAGTNGKGSTAAMLNSILCYSGYKTGLFTSPFIEVFNERIQINNNNISNDDLANYTKRVKIVMEQYKCFVSEFAFITAVAMLYFKENNCDFVVLETGMGGKLDATNVINTPIVSVITSISLDHTQYLGETIEEIAAEKSGIIKKDSIAVIYPVVPKAMNIIEEHCKNVNAQIIKTGKAYEISDGFIYNGIKYPLSLKGKYQPQNAAVVIETVMAMRNKGIKISNNAVYDGLKNVEWPARFEFISENIIIDGSHNIDAMRKLKESLKSLNKPIVLLMAMMADKNCKECVNEITQGCKFIVTTQLNMPRCVSASELLSYSDIEGTFENNPEKALEEALKAAGNDSIVCVCGSLYLAGEIRKKFHTAHKEI